MKKILLWILIVIITVGVIAFGINGYVTLSTKKRIVNDYSKIEDVDCVIILGAAVWGDSPSPMLRDRLDKGIELYNKGVVSKIIMSGDHGNANYDEVNTMKEYAINKGVPSEDIFMDHAGFSTYDSIYRLKHIFGVRSAVIVTQKYHLYRALYIAKKLDIKAYGVNADPVKYRGALGRETREVLARDKDFVKAIFKPKATIMGDAISLDDSGDVTNDK